VDGANVGGLLTVNSGGGITQGAGAIVAHGTLLTAAAGTDIQLTGSGNDFDQGAGNTLTVTAARNVTVADGNGLALGSIALTGNLQASADGDLTQTVALTVPGTSSFTTTGTGAIILGTTTNAFTGAVSLDTQA